MPNHRMTRASKGPALMKGGPQRAGRHMLSSIPKCSHGRLLGNPTMKYFVSQAGSNFPNQTCLVFMPKYLGHVYSTQLIKNKIKLGFHQNLRSLTLKLYRKYTLISFSFLFLTNLSLKKTQLTQLMFCYIDPLTNATTIHPFDFLT